MQQRGEETSIGRLISFLYRHARVYFQRQLEPYGLGHGQMPVLMYINQHEGSTQHDISKHFHLDKGSTSSLIKNLEKQGFVERKQDDADRRCYMLYTTEKTQRLMPEFRNIFKRWTTILLDGFNEEEEEQAFAFLNRMIENAQVRLNEGKRK